MGVGAAEPERTHSGNRTLDARRPGNSFGRYHQAQLIQINVRIGAVEMQVPRDPPVLHGKKHLDQPRDACRCLEMADIRLGGSDNELAIGASRPSENRIQRPKLYGIPQGSGGSMRFNVIHRSGRNSSILQRRPDHFLLGGGVGNGEATAAAVMVDR